ncbi:MAG: M20 family metallopeptidase [Chitinophagales bacterium]|nr:M20 family metallopeptidase [Hyphomicrobiales bacterium]
MACITEDRWLELASDLIRIGQPEACNPLDPDLPSGSEETIARRVATELSALGFDIELLAAEPGRPNVLGRLPGLPGGRSLAFNTHLDTYPALEPEQWTKTDGDPFNPTRHGDWLYARGASDTRGNLASTLLAARAIVEAGVKLKGELICLYTVNEEKNGPSGSIYLTKEKGVKPDAIIVAEPTAWGADAAQWGMSLSVANSGHCLIELIVEGVKSHLWRPDVALNPIDKMVSVLAAISGPTLSYDATLLSGHTPPSVVPLRIEGGIPGELQFTPGRCRAILGGVGLVQGMTIEGILSDIKGHIDRETAGSGFTATVRQFPGSLFISGTEPLSVEEPHCVALRSVYRRFMGGEPRVNRKNAFNDTIRFREAGIPAVTFGPGEDSWAPDNEAISISKAVAAAKIYALTAMDFLGVRDI